MLLETLLHDRGPGLISHVFKRKNVTFFKFHGESFCTAAGKIAHSSSPVYDSSFIHTIADEAHDEDVREERAAQQKDFEVDDTLWQKHDVNTCKLAFMMALQILEERGPDAMMVFIHQQFDIYPTGAMSLVRQLEKEGQDGE